MRVLFLIPVLTLGLAACGLPTKDAVNAETPHQTAVLNGSYQAIYRCFIDARDRSDKGQIYGDLGLAEVNYNYGDEWLGVVEFKRLDSKSTQLNAWHVRESMVDLFVSTAKECASES